MLLGLVHVAMGHSRHKERTGTRHVRGLSMPQDIVGAKVSASRYVTDLQDWRLKITMCELYVSRAIEALVKVTVHLQNVPGSIRKQIATGSRPREEGTFDELLSRNVYDLRFQPMTQSRSGPRGETHIDGAVTSLMKCRGKSGHGRGRKLSHSKFNESTCAKIFSPHQSASAIQDLEARV